MKFTRTTILLIITLLALSTSSYATITIQDTTHPRLFVGCTNCETVAKIRSRCGEVDDSSDEYQDHATEYAAVKAVADHTLYDTESEYDALTDMNQVRVGLTYGFTYLIDQGSTYLDRSKWMLDNIGTWDDSENGWWGIFNACLVFDWVYGDLTSGERTTYAQALSDKLSGSVYYGDYNTFQANYNWRKRMTYLYGLVGQAIYNEDATSAATYWNRMYTIWGRINTFSKEIIEDGGIYPIGQGGYALESGFVPQVLAYGVMKYTGLQGTEITNLDTSALGGIAYGLTYFSPRDGYVIPSGDTQYASSVGPLIPVGYRALPLSILAKEYDGETEGKLTAYAMDKITYGYPEDSEAVYEILFVDKDANTIGSTMSSLANTKIFDDTTIIYREGFTLGSDSNEILFQFHCPKHVNGHSHYAKGHIEIWRGRDYLTFPSGYYETAEGLPSDGHYYFLGDSLSHNTFLVRNSSENSGARPNAGGQLTNEGEGASFQDTNNWVTQGARDDGGSLDLGSIDRGVSGAGYFYGYYRGHSGKLYSATKMDEYSRSVAKVGDFYIVLDRWDGDTGRSDTKRQIWQAPPGDSGIEGGSWSGSAPDEVDSTTRNFFWDTGGSRLHVYRVFPSPSASAYNRRIGGGSGSPATYQFYSRNESVNYDGTLEGDEPYYGLWRLEFEETGQEDGLFLTVLYPTSDTTSMPTTYAIGSATSGDHIGVEIDTASGDDILVIFSNDVTESTDSEYNVTVNLATNHDVLVVDLADGNYTIEGGNSTATDSNAVFFDSVALNGDVPISAAAQSTPTFTGIGGSSGLNIE